jgi:hypothetical protein
MTIDHILFGVMARFAENYCLAETERQKMNTDFEFRQFMDSPEFTPVHRREYNALYDLIKHDYETVKKAKEKVN